MYHLRRFSSERMISKILCNPLPPLDLAMNNLSMSLFGCNALFIVIIFRVCLSIFSSSSLFQLTIPPPYTRNVYYIAHLFFFVNDSYVRPVVLNFLFRLVAEVPRISTFKDTIIFSSKTLVAFSPTLKTVLLAQVPVYCCSYLVMPHFFVFISSKLFAF